MTTNTTTTALHFQKKRFNRKSKKKTKQWKKEGKHENSGRQNTTQRNKHSTIPTPHKNRGL
jgi:hypothetical protein